MKDAALECLASILSFFVDALDENDAKETSKLICDRLHNEVTRLAAVQSLEVIASSENCDRLLTPMLYEIESCFVTFLRKNSSRLRIVSTVFVVKNCTDIMKWSDRRDELTKNEPGCSSTSYIIDSLASE